MIYFIRGKESGNIKIGFTMYPYQRKANLQTANYEELEFLGLMDGTLADEAKIQKKFMEFNIRGEWYYPSEEIISFIKKNERPQKNVVSSLGKDVFRLIFVYPL